ncbi:replication protein [Bacillus cereus]|uniref:replication protein n=1 Tax=Paenibacillus melissococcoides TaxID=2912268 RepID=UPI002DD1E2D3|nr:replication protein [Bacillus cereus]
MASPQKENGYVGIANEIWDEIISRKFTERQQKILKIILRLSYGCRKKTATIPLLKHFELGGVRIQDAKKELNYLTQCKVIEWDQKDTYSLNKNYDEWRISLVKGWDEEEFKRLISLNINSKTGSENGETRVTKSVTSEPVPEEESYEKCNHPVTKSVSSELRKVELSNAANPCGSKAEGTPKDSIKDSIKNNIKDQYNSGGLFPEPDINFGKAYQVIQKYFGLAMNAVQIDKLQDYLKAGMEPEVIEKAAILTRENGQGIRYMWGVLDNCSQSGIMTVAAWNEDQARRRSAPTKGSYNRNQKPALPIVERVEQPLNMSQDEIEQARALARALDEGRAP